MTAQMWLQIGLVLLIVFLLSILVGRYLADIRHGSEDPVGSGLRSAR
jgi:K+-transporting ATPase A subunit